MKCPKCSKEGFRYIVKKVYNKDTDKWTRSSYEKSCSKCGYEED